MKDFEKSKKLDGVCYDIRGPILEHATRLEEEGHRVLKLNIGNPAPFGFDAPDEMIADVIHNIRNAQGYVASKGLFAARKAIMQECQRLEIPDVEIDDIFLGNGVSELIVMANQALLNNGDEVSVPSPDYPLWTAAVTLSGGHPVHYMCDEQAQWQPDIEDIKKKITPPTILKLLTEIPKKLNRRFPENANNIIVINDTIEAFFAVLVLCRFSISLVMVMKIGMVPKGLIKVKKEVNARSANETNSFISRIFYN